MNGETGGMDMEAVLDEITEENTFRQRVADFWHLFAEQEYEIRYLHSFAKLR